MSNSRNFSVLMAQALVGGLVATVAMTGLMLMAPKMGMPKMDVGGMLAGMLHLPTAMGWVMHFVIGMMFAIPYCLFVRAKLGIQNNLAAGLIYGVVVFLVAQLLMIGMSATGLMAGGPLEAGAKAIMGSLMGHLFYGLVLGFFIKKESH